MDSLSSILREKPTIALDIEGGIDTMSCISFATTANMAFIVPFIRKNGSKSKSKQMKNAPASHGKSVL